MKSQATNPPDDLLKPRTVIPEIVPRIGIDTDIKRLDMTDHGQIVIRVLIDPVNPLPPLDQLNLEIDPHPLEEVGDDPASPCDELDFLHHFVSRKDKSVLA